MRTRVVCVSVSVTDMCLLIKCEHAIYFTLLTNIS